MGYIQEGPIKMYPTFYLYFIYMNLPVCPDVVGCHMVEPLYTCVYMYVFKLEWPEHTWTYFSKGEFQEIQVF